MDQVPLGWHMLTISILFQTEANGIRSWKLTENKECSEWTLAPTCGSLGQIETVGVVNFRAARLLAGDELTSIPTAETLILSFLCDFTLAPAFPMLLLLEFS